MANATNYLRQEFRGDALERLAGLQVQAYDEEELAGKVLEAARIRGETGVSTAASARTIEALLQQKKDTQTTLKPGLDLDKIRLQVQLLQRLLKVKRALPSGSHGIGEAVGAGQRAMSAAGILDTVGRAPPLDDASMPSLLPASRGSDTAGSSGGASLRFVQSRSMPLPPPSPPLHGHASSSGAEGKKGKGRRAGGVRFAEEEAAVQLIPSAQREAGELQVQAGVGAGDGRGHAAKGEKREGRRKRAAQAQEEEEPLPAGKPHKPSKRRSSKSQDDEEASAGAVVVTCPVCSRALGPGLGERAVSAHVDRCLRRGAGSGAGDGEDSDSGASDSAPVATRRARPFAALPARGTGKHSDDTGDGEEEGAGSKRKRKAAAGDGLRPAPDMRAVLEEDVDDFAQAEGDEVDEREGGTHSEEAEEEEEEEEGGGVSVAAIKARAGGIRGDGKLSRADRASFAVHDDWEEAPYEARVAAFERRYGDGSGQGDLALAGGTGGGGLTVPHFIASQLLPYQCQGVAWLWGLHRSGVGGCLGDEMGLGKTVQMTALLGALHAAGRLRPSIVVCPATVIAHWVRELTTWWPPLRVLVLHDSGSGLAGLDAGAKQARRRQIVKKVLTSGDVLVTTYEALRLHSELLLRPKWGYAVLDEGHRVRNPEAGVTQAAKALHTVHRILLTGAPIQNRLRELWSLFDFCYPGRLGSLTMFESQFTQPIAAGGWSHATPLQVSTAVQCALVLRDLISPYLLRRLKRDVASQLPTKTEQVLFCRLAPLQRALYARYLRGRDVSGVLDGTGQAFKPVTVLRKICNHPRLLEAEDFAGGNDARALTELLSAGRGQGQGVGEDSGEEGDEGDGEGAAPRADPLLEASGKLKVMAEILRLWKSEGRRCLLFCQGTRMLDIIQGWVSRQGWGWLRMDGTTPVGTRQALVDAFNTKSQYFVFLLTTRVGGVGVNLIGADRVLIYDPDWNPSTDTQARERAWRLGQRKHVTIYRLITAGAIEEKIYQRQVFKTVLTQRVLTDPRSKRQFSYQDLRDLFTLSDEPSSSGGGGAGGSGSSAGRGSSSSSSGSGGGGYVTDTQLMLPEHHLELSLSALPSTAGLVAMQAYHDPDSEVRRKGASGSSSSSKGRRRGVKGGGDGSLLEGEEGEEAPEEEEEQEFEGEEEEGDAGASSSPAAPPPPSGASQTTVLASLIDGGGQGEVEHESLQGLGPGERTALARASARIAGEALKALQPTMTVRERERGERSSPSPSPSLSPTPLSLPLGLPHVHRGPSRLGTASVSATALRPAAAVPVLAPERPPPFPPPGIGTRINMRCWQGPDDPGGGESIIRAASAAAGVGMDVLAALGAGSARRHALLGKGWAREGGKAGGRGSGGRITVPGLQFLPSRKAKQARQEEVAAAPSSTSTKVKVHLPSLCLPPRSLASSPSSSLAKVHNSVSNAYSSSEDSGSSGGWMDTGSSGVAARAGSGTLPSALLLARLTALRGAGGTGK